jgi:hypothetical protein
LNICYSCEGGAQYSGEVVWLLPEFHSGNGVQFTVYFNANEEKGITVLQFEKEEKENIKKRFPLHDVKLRKCKGKTYPDRSSGQKPPLFCQTVGHRR